jgi:hypothetical protein
LKLPFKKKLAGSRAGSPGRGRRPKGVAAATEEARSIGSIWCGTLMRHVIFARPVAACARRMIDAAVTTALVTATGFALRTPTRFPGAARGAINMAAIAIAADQYLDPAALTQE